MCGVAAILKLASIPCPAFLLDQMRDEVTYRGPDDFGSVFFRDEGGTPTKARSSDSRWDVGLGHRRLSILDLSQAAHQPMCYRDRFWTIFNGEVYNFIELREELGGRGHNFISESDTEVVLAAYAEWGSECFSRFRGMWGLVILDTTRHEIILSRDRLGIKPLYLWKGPGITGIASEVKQFRHIPQFTPHLDPAMAVNYFQTGYEDAERTFIRDVEPIKPGCWVRIPLDTGTPSPPQRYWQPERVQVSVTNSEEAGELFAKKLQESIAIHLRSDVPVGCALSGGLDSSAIASLVDSLTDGKKDPLHTFTVTFPGEEIDEREYVDAVLAVIHGRPHFLTPDPQMFLSDLDRFLWIHDEPVGSISVYAAYCLGRLTRAARVPVTLNGQGGDEIFSGYWQSYFLYLFEQLRHHRFLTLANHFGGALTPYGNPTLIKQVPVMLRRYMARTKPSPYLRFHKSSTESQSETLNAVMKLDGQARRLHEIQTMFLPKLLRYDDRNMMAFSVEGRYPFLDHELIELCLSFAPSTLYKYGWTKWPLRLGLRDTLPTKILHRRSKFGFETPQSKWLSGAMRPVLQQWIRGDSLVWDFVDRKGVERLAEHVWGLKGQQRGHQEESGQTLFRLFIFHRWAEVFGIKG